MPELWNVHLEEQPKEGLINLIAAWFSQCSSTQILFTMEKWRRQRLLTLTADHLLGEVIIPYAHRFKALGSVLTQRGYLYSLPFDVLTTLSIRYSPWITNPGEFMFAPLLQSVTITDVNQIATHTVPTALPHLPWAQLTSLCVEGSLTFGDVRELLSWCTFLENARFDSIKDSSPELSLDVLVLPYLKDLRIIFDSLTSTDGLGSLTIPNLASLITNLPPITSAFFEKFLAFMATFKRSLRHFELEKTGVFTIKAPVEHIIHALPFATHFIVKDQNIGPSTLAMIGRRELLPNLKVLQFKALRNDRVDEILDNLIPPDMIQKTNIKSIGIHATGSRDPSISQRIENLLSFGISVDLL